MMSLDKNFFGLSLIICFIVLVGIIFRLKSIGYNSMEHGDVALYSAAAESLARGNGFLVDSDISQPYFYSLAQHGGRLLEHNPIFPILGAILVLIFGISGFFALKILSFLGGILLLFVVYRLGKKIGGKLVAEFALALCAISYILIDYSGNGSFYILQAVMYGFFILILLEPLNLKRAFGVGAFIALTSLLNQQAAILFFVYIIHLAIVCLPSTKNTRDELVGFFARIKYLFGRGIFDYKKFAKFFFASSASMVLVMLPWWVRSYFEFGSPFYSVAITNIWQKMGLEQIVQNGVIHYAVSGGTYIELLEKMISFWVPHNLYFVNRQLFILLPFGYILFFIFGVQSLFRDGADELRKFELFWLVLFFHIALSVCWPIVKFRYFVPIIPLMYIMIGYEIFFKLKIKKWYNHIIVIIFLLSILFSVCTYLSTPTHTYYNGGTITEDPFGKKGELDFVTQNLSNVSSAAIINN